ncbi:MAG TPA: hypothetical protein VE999_12260 [Gemmataceae bacterium]|nr:hypothetical protein [Gemmataceae bacterium]
MINEPTDVVDTETQVRKRCPSTRYSERRTCNQKTPKRLELAYKYAVRSLSLVDRNDPLTRIVAEKIVEVAASERDPAKISEIVIKQFGA